MERREAGVNPQFDPYIGHLNRVCPQGPFPGWQCQPLLLSRRQAPRGCLDAEGNGSDVVTAASP